MPRINRSISLFAFIFLFGCSQNLEKPSQKQLPLFQKLPSQISGFNFTNILAENENFNLFTWLYIYNGAGVATGDINNDGLVDIYMISNVGPNKLFLNEGEMTFKDITKQSKTSAATGYKTGVTMVDINGDGWLDIYLCRDVFPDPKMRRNLVYINNRDLTFTEKGVELGLTDQSYSTQALFLDIDQDNDLDIYLINHPPSFENATNIKPNRSAQNNQNGNILFENINGQFSNISKKAGVDFSGFGLSGMANDFNNDGLTDIYVANDFIEPDLLYINNGNHTFSESFDDYFNHLSQNSMGCDMADINNDGILDLIVTDMLAESNVRQKVFDTNMKINRYEQMIDNGYGKQMMRNSLFLGNENGKYSEIGQLLGIEKSDWSWSPIFSDVNLDGNTDLLITNGIMRDMGDKDFIDFRTDSLQKAQKKGIQAWTNKTALKWLKMIPSTPVENHLYLNYGNLAFQNSSQALGLNDKTFSQGAVFSDLDNDGDQDLIISNQGIPAVIYENTNTENKAVKVKLIGPEGNNKALGAKVNIYANGKESAQLVTANRGFLSSPDQALHVGLKPNTTIDSIIVFWPDGLIQLEKNQAWGEIIVLNYDKQKNHESKPELIIRAEENTQATPLSFTHKENQFDDFKRQPLLINTNSKEGPALAQNKNGHIFVGGAFGQHSKIYFDGKTQTLENSNRYEDVDALFIDLDNDGVDELYVVSGGTQHLGKHVLYNDRQYKFQNGQYSLYNSTKTSTSGAVVTAADIDNNEFMDLFVGSSHIPGSYPESPFSYFVNNVNGELSISDSIKLGNVRDATFLDLNKDGLKDLIVVGEWMPITILTNQGKGKFIDETVKYGLDNSHGWWQSLCILAAEETVTIAVGNYGLNTPYKVSKTEPLNSYTFDFDGNETKESIITQYIEGEEWPLPRKEIITDVLPSLKKRYLNNKAYGLAKINDLFEREKIAKSEKHFVKELRSGIFTLNAANKFEFTPFNIQAQFSPINDFEYLDINDDGQLDLVFAAGMEYTEVEQGPMVALSLGAIIQNSMTDNDNTVLNLLQGKAIQRITIVNKEEKLILTAENNGPIKSYNITW